MSCMVTELMLVQGILREIQPPLEILVCVETPCEAVETKSKREALLAGPSTHKDLLPHSVSLLSRPPYGFRGFLLRILRS